jgi:hypothetical protein
LVTAISVLIGAALGGLGAAILSALILAALWGSGRTGTLSTAIFGAVGGIGLIIGGSSALLAFVLATVSIVLT